MTYLIYILAFAVLLGVLVTIHEFGHFIVARMCKVHVQRFSIGMGPVFYKKLDKHGTEFALSAIPLGGYVSMITNKLIELEPEISNQLTEEQLKNTFDSKPKWQRASIMFAGPLANFLLSIFIFTKSPVHTGFVDFKFEFLSFPASLHSIKLFFLSFTKYQLPVDL